MTCPGHRSDDDFRLRKKFFDPLDERDGAEYFSNGRSVDPNGLVEGKGWEASHPLNEFLSKSLVDKGPEQKIRRSGDKEKCENDVVE